MNNMGQILVRHYKQAMLMHVSVLTFSAAMLAFILWRRSDVWLIVVASVCLGSTATTFAYGMRDLYRSWRQVLIDIESMRRP